MKNFLTSLFTPSKPHSVATELVSAGSSSCTKVSLHQMVNRLLTGLQPLAMRRGNVILNGTPDGLAFVMEENKLATALRQLISGALTNRKNECIHIITLVADDSTMVCIKNGIQGVDASYTIPNTLMAFDR